MGGGEVEGRGTELPSLVWLEFEVRFGFFFTATVLKDGGGGNEEWGTTKEKEKEEKYFCADVD